MTDYQRIAKVISFVGEKHHEQPSLKELAALVGLSVHHFQRLFVRWAGVSPKKFLQCVTADAAIQRLKRGQSILSTALDEGLSGPGRLHDLTILLQSASPGEIKSGGEGWQLEIGFAATPFGDCFIAISPRGICRLGFVSDRDQHLIETELRAEWPNATLTWDDQKATKLVDSIFLSPSNGPPKNRPPLQCLVRGTQFQIRVWRALLEIPSGQLTTYSAIANSIGKSGANRAVGSAIGKNPIGFLIPCHRVIRATGLIGEYRWGQCRKHSMIAREIAGNKLTAAET